MYNMLDCNITEKLYADMKKRQFGICSNTDTLLSMALNELRVDLACSSVVVCYEPETCSNTTTSCNIALTQPVSSTPCAIVLVQSFDDP